jgi:hypothetical protein
MIKPSKGFRAQELLLREGREVDVKANIKNQPKIVII